MARVPLESRQAAKPQRKGQHQVPGSAWALDVDVARLGRAAFGMAGAVSVACFVAYWLTHGSGPYWQDSGLFLAALKAGGGLLSPGYPVYLLLGRPFVAVFRTLLPGRAFAEAGNTFSALWAALAAGLTSLSILTVVTPGYGFFRPQPAHSSTRRAKEEPVRHGRPASAFTAAALGGLLAGLSYSLWFQALTAEAYALNAFFAALVLFLVLRLGAERAMGPEPTPRQRRLLLLLLLAYGLSCGNHPVTVVFLPALAWMAWTQRAVLRNRQLLVGAAGVYVCSALLPYLYLPWAANAYPATPFSHVTSPSALIAHMLGSQWTGRSESFGVSGDRFFHFPLQLWQELFAVGLLGLLAGFIMLRREQRALLGFLVLLLLPAGLLPILYLRGGEYDFWLLPFYMACFLVAGLGLHSLLKAILGARLPVTVRIAGAAALAILALAPLLIVNLPLLDRRADFAPEDFGRNLYRHLAPDAVLIATSDQENALTYFLDTVEGLRPDVIRLDAGSVATPFPQAVSAYSRALSTDPGLDPPGILFGLGKALFLADRNDEALKYLERVGGRLGAARTAEASLYLGQIQAAKGNWQTANEHFETVRRLDPELWARIQASPRRSNLLPPRTPSPEP